MSHWKWRETKRQPSRARSGHQISCSLVSLHFLCDILAPITVQLKTIKVFTHSGICKERKIVFKLSHGIEAESVVLDAGHFALSDQAAKAESQRG